MNNNYNNPNQQVVTADMVREANQQAQMNQYQDRQRMNEIIAKQFPKLVKTRDTDLIKNNFTIAAIIMIGLGLLSLLFGDIGILFLVIFGIVGLIVFFVGLADVNKRKKLPYIDFNMVQNELYANDCIFIEKAKAFFTTNYIVSYGVQQFVLNYNDVRLMYSDIHQENTNANTGLIGAVVANAITAAMGNKDVFLGLESGVMFNFFVGDKDNEIMNIIYQHNNNVLYGNSKENLQAYKNMKSMYKQNMKAQQQMQQPVQQMPQQNYQQPMNNQGQNNNYNNPNQF